jgi:hypothetical protein
MFEGVPDAAVVLAIGDSARAENIACARRLAAIVEQRRQIPVEDGYGRELWRNRAATCLRDSHVRSAGVSSSGTCLHLRRPSRPMRAHATFQKIIYLIVIKRPKPQIHYAAAASDRYA